MTGGGWLGGYEQTLIDGRPGLVFREEVPTRITVHSTEGSTAASAIGAYRSGTGPPHLTVEYEGNVRHQHVPLDRGAYALRNDAGGVQTNAIANVQIEWVGFAAEGFEKTPGELEWFAGVLVDCARELVDLGLIKDDFELVWPEFFDHRSGFVLARKDAKQRSLYDEWYSGRWTLYGHQHVPENTHWDPGLINWPHVDAEFERRFRPVTTLPPDEIDERLVALERKLARAVEINARQGRYVNGLQTRVGELEKTIDVLTLETDVGILDRLASLEAFEREIRKL